MGATVESIITNARFRHYTEDEIRRRFDSLVPKKQKTLDIDLDMPVERPRARRKVVGDG